MKLLISLVWLFVSSLAVAADYEPELLVQLAKDRIYEGESVSYAVIPNHVENPSTPKLDGFDDFVVEFQGQRRIDLQQTQNINGERRAFVLRGHVFSYLLTPKRSGELTVPAPTCEVNGKVLQGQSFKLHVVAPEEQDFAFLEILVDKTAVYPVQPFTVTLKIAVKGIPDPLDEKDPVALLASISRPSQFSMSFFDERVPPPVLSIPWAEDEGLQGGVIPDRPLERWLGRYVANRGGGFSINNYSFRGRKDFSPSGQRIRRNDGSGRSTGYWEYSFDRKFLAKQVGEYSFGPATLKGELAARVNARGQVGLEEVYVMAKPAAVTVKDAPLDGRPASYAGLIGRFEFESQLAPTKAKVGDPMTLTVTLRGQGTLDAVTAPRLEDISEIAGHFRIHEATEESDDEVRRFTYGLRPLDTGIDSFPPIEMSYFDVEQEEYITLHTEKIPLQIGTAEKLASGDIAMADTSPSGGGDIEMQEGGLLANHTLASLRNDSVDPLRWFAGLGSLAGVYLIVLLVTQRVRRVIADPDLVRRRTAATRARRRLRDATRSQAGTQAEVESLRAAIVGLIADASGIDEAGLTTGEVREQLVEIGTDEPIVARLTEWCEACDAARYGASADAVHGLEHEAQALLENLIKTFKSKKQLR